MKQYLFILSLAASCPVFAQTKHPSDADAAPRVNIPFEFTSEEENKLLKEDDSLKYFVANGDGTNTVCINDEQSYYKLLNKDHKVIAEGSFIAEGEKYLQDGKWTTRFENGKLKLTGYFVRNKPIGTWHEYHANGKLKAIYNFAVIAENGETVSCLSGSYEEFYQNGKIKVHGLYLAAGSKVYDTLSVEDPVTMITVEKVVARYTYTPERTGHWEYYNENGEPEKNDDN